MTKIVFGPWSFVAGVLVSDHVIDKRREKKMKETEIERQRQQQMRQLNVELPRQTTQEHSGGPFNLFSE